MQLDLEGKIALVTAASEGLGFAVANMLAAEGAKVIINSRSQEKLRAAADIIITETGNKDIHPIAADLSDSQEIKKLLQEIKTKYNRLDILITNTAGPPIIDFIETTQAQWLEAYQLILNSCVELVMYSVPLLKQQSSASILTITSFAAKEPKEHFILSNTMRPAVLGFTKTLSKELGRDNIRVNSILPGYTLTKRLESLFEIRAQRNNSTVVEEIQKISATIPLQRIGTPTEFAKAACFLVSSAASYISGVSLVVDGGVSQSIV